MKKNKRSVKILSLILVLVMAFSLVPVSASAESYRGGSASTNGWSSWWNWGWGGWWNWGWDDPEPEPEPEEPVVEEPTEPEEPVVEEPTEPTEPTEPVVEEPTEPTEPVVEEPTEPEEPVVEVTYPAVDFEPVELDGLTVSVSAPEGALPEGTEMTATKIENMDAVQAAVDQMENMDVTALMAVDISFWHEGEEIEPNDEVTVTMTAPELADVDGLEVIHIPDASEPEAMPQILVDDPATVMFASDSFSTYVLAGTNQSSITVHYVYKDGNNYRELGASKNTTFPTGTRQAATTYNNNSEHFAFLKYDFDGYVYKETRVGTTSGNLIYPVLKVNRSGGFFSSYTYTWQYAQRDASNWSNLTSNGNVYVIYEARNITSGASGDGTQPGQEQPTVPDLPAGKNVHDNGDGTFDITLSVTGAAGSQEQVTKANVIVIFDTSGSMRQDFDGYDTGDSESTTAGNSSHDSRLYQAAQAVNTLANNLLNKKDNAGNKLVQMALVKFDTQAETVTGTGFDANGYTSDPTTFTRAVNNLTTNGITNWEQALLFANGLPVSQESPTFVVFVSDGAPTARVSRLNLTDADILTLNGGQPNNSLRLWSEDYAAIFGSGSYNQGHYDAALTEAESILTHNKTLYSIGLSTDAERLEDFTADAYTGANVTIPAGEKRYFPANSQSDLNEAFDKIANAVSESLGFSEVTLDDGVTKLSTVEIALVGGASEYVCRKGTNTDPSQNPVWTDAPAPEIDEQHHVKWSPVDGELEKDVTYSITFTVWPSQKSYDIIADINNGIIRDAEGNIVRTGTPAEAFASQPESVRKQIVLNANGKYTLTTNTDFNVTYEYNGVPGSKPVTDYDNGSMPLATSYFGMHKDWQNQLPEDSRTAQVLTKKGEDNKDYLVDANGNWILDGENPIEADWSKFNTWKDKAVFYVDLIVTKGTEDYTEVRLYSKDIEGGNSAWTWNQMFIAPGVLTHGNATSGTFDLRETGDDYSVREKPSESYYWELKAETYHPMVINGTACVLQKVAEDDANVPAAVKGEANANKYSGDYYNIGGTVYKKLGSADDALISAVNERRSYLNITKAVTGTDLTGYDADAYFTYTVKMENPNGKYQGADGYNPKNDDFWFSVMDADKETIKDASIVTGAIAEEGNTGYWHVANVQGGSTVTIKMKAGWNIRFINLLSGTTYEVNETAMDDGFVFNKVEATAVKNGTPDNTYAPTIDGTKINGSIVNPNTDYTVTYTNDFLGYFYVYHSANNNVQRFPMAVNGVKYEAGKKTFNIAELTDANSLYGGYYLNYAGKGDGFEATKVTTWTDNKTTDTNDNAKMYDGTNVTWSNGETVSGLAMVPKANATYFIKEVPADKYLQPYLHYTYYKDGTGFIPNAWLISDIDDLNYEETGFVIVKGNNAANVVSSLTVETAHGGTRIKLNPKRVFGVSSTVNKLTYLEVVKGGSGLHGFAAGSEILQYWVTPDKLIVTGTTQRTYSGITNKDTIGYKATPVTSKIAEFNPATPAT